MLSVYRRHKRDCKAGHPHELRTNEFDERKKGWKRCACPIVASGTLNRVAKRQSTGAWEWDAAKQVTAAWEQAGSWDGKVEPAVVTAPTVEGNTRVTIERAVKSFLSEMEETAAFATRKKYRLLFKQLTAFSEQRGYVMVDQWQPIDVREFRTAWKISPQTAARRMSMLKPFFEYCVSNKWISDNPARLVKNPRGRDAKEQPEEKQPFTDDELKRMYDACQAYGQTYRHKWKGEDLADFISISIYTGLRISDVAKFNMEKSMLPSGDIKIRTTKAGTNVYTWIPEWLQERIRERAKIHGPHIFGEHRTETIDVISELWRRKLNILWELCGPWKEKPTPHRFRHTFARILLQKPNVTVRDVAELLGNTEDMVRKHYSAWVTDRQDRLRAVLQEAFTDKPRPKLVKMPARG